MGANNGHEFCQTTIDQRITEKQARGDFGAQITLRHGLALKESGKTEEQSQMGDRLIRYAGQLAVLEAEFDGARINWDGTVGVLDADGADN